MTRSLPLGPTMYWGGVTSMMMMMMMMALPSDPTPSYLTPRTRLPQK